MRLLQDIYLTRKSLAGFIAIGLAWAVYFAQMPVIKAQVGASDAAYGLSLLVASLGAIAAMWLAPLCQRLFGSAAIALSILVLGGGMLAAGASDSLMMLIGAMTLASAASGVIDVLANARASEIEQETGRGVMNLNHALYSFAYTIGALATGAARGQEVTPVPIFAGLCLALFVLALSSRGARPAQIEVGDGLPAGLPVVLVVLTGLIVLVAFLTEAATEGWSALHLERTLEGSAAIGAMGPAMLGLTMGIGRMSGHLLSQRMRDTHLMLAALLMSSVGVTVAGLAPDIGIALLGFGIAGLGISVVVPLAMSLIGRVVPPVDRLSAISKASAIGYGAFFFGPSLMGFISELYGLRTAFYVVAALLTITALILVPALARQASRQDSPQPT